MMDGNWSQQDAEKRFASLVDATLAGEPQLVTLPGKPAVVVVSAETFERLNRLAPVETEAFADLLLAMPQDDGAFDAADVRPREISF